jgi:tryptophan halogenase
MEIPPSLAHRKRLWKESAHAYQVEGELFRVDSWTEVMLGQRFWPEHYHHVARALTEQELLQSLEQHRSAVAQAVSNLPPQMEFISQYCKASSDVWGTPPAVKPAS